MLIECPKCQASYDVEPAQLGRFGRTVRCARCRMVWFAPNSAAMSTASGATGSSAVEGRPPQAPAKPLEGRAADWTLAANNEGASAASISLPIGPGEALPAPPTANGTGDVAADPPESTAPTPLAAEEAPSIVPADDGPVTMPPNPPEPTASKADVESLASRPLRRAPSRRNRGWRPSLPSLIFCFSAALTILIVWRNDVVRLLPQTATLFETIGLSVNVRGLVIDNVKTTREVQDGVMMLVVEGTIANITSRTVEVPRLRFAIRNAAGLEIYAWTAVVGPSVLASGETASFRTRLAAPPADGRDVIVRFFSRRDVIAGIR